MPDELDGPEVFLLIQTRLKEERGSHLSFQPTRWDVIVEYKVFTTQLWRYLYPSYTQTLGYSSSSRSRVKLRKLELLTIIDFKLMTLPNTSIDDRDDCAVHCQIPDWRW